MDLILCNLPYTKGLVTKMDKKKMLSSYSIGCVLVFFFSQTLVARVAKFFQALIAVNTELDWPFYGSGLIHAKYPYIPYFQGSTNINTQFVYFFVTFSAESLTRVQQFVTLRRAQVLDAPQPNFAKDAL